ncbi:MAG: hypothetical protein DME82_05920 [Verrucomicrobia bacterium]|nr:MAG: hypothetical protein DME82_05920 [Verrucomicrobiota bacterium]
MRLFDLGVLPGHNLLRCASHCAVIRKLTEHFERLTENLIGPLKPKDFYGSIFPHDVHGFY